MNRLIGLVGKVIVNDQGYMASIEDFKSTVHDTSLLNTQHYKVCIKGKVEQSRERCYATAYTSV